MTIAERKQRKRAEYTTKEIDEHKQKYQRYLLKRKDLSWQTKTWNELLNVVKERLDPSLSKDSPFCPFCNSTNVDYKEGWQTCVGGSGDYDPNHHWDPCTCKDCGETWTMEYKGHSPNICNVWLVQKGRILRGLPTCFESYIYTCRFCGSDVKRHYTEPGTKQDLKSGVLSSRVTEGGEWVHDYDVYYRCDNCKAEVKCFNEYYIQYNRNPHEPRRPCKPWTGWTIVEEIGIVVVNDKARDKLTKD